LANPQNPQDSSASIEEMPEAGYLLDEPRAAVLAARISAAGQGRGQLHEGPARAVILVTRGCDLRCTYCKSRANDAHVFAVAAVERLLGALASQGTRHAHFTGGEPMQHPELPRMVRAARSLGLDTSISTSAVAGPEGCLRLVAAGMQRFYISLDTFDPEIFDGITGSRRLLPRVLDAIAALVGARPSGRKVHVTVNKVLRRSEVAGLLADEASSLRSLLSTMMALGADDFKLLPDATEAGGAFSDPAESARFVAVCRQLVPETHRMFHYRLRTLASGGHGLSPAKAHHCYHAVDDRVFASDGAYACIIQQREGGPVLYRHEDPPEHRESVLGQFIASDRRQDGICRRHCFDVYRCLSDAVARKLGS
jgi:pyruvate-formate lyase-activating enzyme